LTIKNGIIHLKIKNSMRILQDYFLFPLGPARKIPAEIKSPAITARGERGRPGVREGTTAGGRVISGEETWVTVAFASTPVVRMEFSGETTVRVLMSEFFIDGLLIVRT
jgi:hypothetical protein